MNSGMDNVEVIYTVVHQERLRFSARLVHALQTAGYDTPGATEVARLYNAHSNLRCPTMRSANGYRAIR